MAFQLHYVSLQLVNYLYDANYGNGLAFLFPSLPASIERQLDGSREDIWLQLANLGFSPEMVLERWQELEGKDTTITMDDLMKIDVRQSMRLLFERQITTKAVLFLLSYIIPRAGHLLHGNRIHYDANMVKYFYGEVVDNKLVPANMHYYITRNGVVEDITPRESTTWFSQDISGFQYLAELPPQNNIPSLVLYDPNIKQNWGIFVGKRNNLDYLFNELVIPKELLNAEELEALDNPLYKANVQSSIDDLKRLALTYRDREDDANKKRRKLLRAGGDMAKAFPE